MLNDLRHALRALRKSPGFTAVAVALLALGLGASVTVLSAAKAVVVDVLPYPQPERLVAIWSSRPAQPLSSPDFLDIAAQNSTLEDSGAFAFRKVNLGGDPAESVDAVASTAGLARTLGVKVTLGRFFEDADAKAGERLAVISHGLWQRRFAGDPSALGRTLRLDGDEVRVIGILPAGFELQTQRSGERTIDVWMALMLEPVESERGSHWLLAVGRLKPGVTVAQSRADLEAIGARLLREHPRTNQHKPFVARALEDEVTAGPLSRLPVLIGAVVLVLLMTCANVGCMLLARGAHRQREFGVRLALGAPRTAAARLILAESLWLSCGGIAVGAVLATWGTAFVRGVLLDGAGAAGVLQFDLPLFLASAALVGTSALVSGLTPALAASHSVAWNALRAGGRTRGGSPLRDRLLGLLVVAQIAVALVLANGAVMLTASYRNVWRENRALRGSRAVTAGVALAGARYETPEARARFWQAFLARVRALPGVKAAAVTSKLPLEGGNNGSFLVEGEAYDAAARRPLIERSAVSPDYFAAMGLHFLQGGTLRPAGNDARIVDLVVNQAFVDRYWRGQSALGRSVFPNAADPAWKGVVVGVIENVRQWGADAPPMPEVYVDYGFWSRSNASLVMSPARAPAQLLPSVRAQLAAVDRDLALSRVRLMEDVIGESTRSRRRLMQLIDAFMLAALVIAALGVYGTLSHAVTRRRGEIGIRMAVGAEPRAVILDVIRMARGWIVSGLVLGIAGALGSARLAHSALFGVKAIEPLGTSLVTLAVAATLLAACWLPARRAARVDPIEALRCE